MPKKKFGLIIEPSKDEAKTLAKEIKDWLEKRNCEAHESIFKDLDFIITFGGDGTVLKTANAAAPYDIPMARVNFGTTGYLCNIEPGRMSWALKQILACQYRTETRTRIKANIVKGEKELVRSFDAFNEIVVGSTPKKKTAWLQVSIIDFDKNYRKTIKASGDGLIIATQSGSTGYCLSTDGPALLLDAFTVVASNGRFSGFLPPYARSFVTSCNTKFEITVRRGGSNLPCVEADSNDERTHNLKERERVIITKSPRKNLFIEF